MAQLQDARVRLRRVDAERFQADVSFAVEYGMGELDRFPRYELELKLHFEGDSRTVTLTRESYVPQAQNRDSASAGVNGFPTPQGGQSFGWRRRFWFNFNPQTPYARVEVRLKADAPEIVAFSAFASIEEQGQHANGYADPQREEVYAEMPNGYGANRAYEPMQAERAYMNQGGYGFQNQNQDWNQNQNNQRGYSNYGPYAQNRYGRQSYNYQSNWANPNGNFQNLNQNQDWNQNQNNQRGYSNSGPYAQNRYGRQPYNYQSNWVNPNGNFQNQNPDWNPNNQRGFSNYGPYAQNPYGRQPYGYDQNFQNQARQPYENYTQNAQNAFGFGNQPGFQNGFNSEYRPNVNFGYNPRQPEYDPTRYSNPQNAQQNQHQQPQANANWEQNQNQPNAQNQNPNQNEFARAESSAFGNFQNGRN